MIVYDNLWETMRKKQVSKYKLINTYNVSSSQIYRLKRNENVNTYTINRLCEILDCNVTDIMSYKRQEN